MSSETPPDEFDNDALPNRRVLAWLRTGLPRSQFFRSMLLLTGGTVFGQAAVILVTPVLTRVYSSADFGVLAIYGALLSIITVVASLRYEWAIPLPEKNQDAIGLLMLSAGVLLVITAASVVGVNVFGDAIRTHFHAPHILSYLWLVPVGVFMAGGYQILNYWAIRHRQFKAVAKTKFSQGAGMALVQTGLGFLGMGPFGLLLGDIAGRTVGVGGLTAMMWRREHNHLKNANLAGVQQMAVRYRKFPLFSASSSLINSCGLQLPALMFAGLFGVQVAGWYALLQRIVLAPGGLVTQVVSQVYLGELSAAIHTPQGRARARQLFMKISLHLALFGGVPIVIACLVAPRLFGLVLGAGWVRVGEYTQVIAPFLILDLIASPLSMTLVLRELQSWQFCWDVTRLLMVVGSIWFAAHAGLNDLRVMLVYGAIMAIMYALLWIMCLCALSYPREGTPIAS